LEPQGTATPRSAITATPRVTPTPNKIVEWFESIFPPQLAATTSTTEISSLGVASPATDTGSNVLWGATAAAVMGSLAAYALEEKRKQQEEKAQLEERAKLEEKAKQEEKARQEALEAKEDQRRKRIKTKQMAKLEAKWAEERAWEAAREAEEQRKEAIYQAHMEERLLGREIQEEAKRVAEEKAEQERKQAEKERKRAEELEAAYAASAITRKKGEEAVVTTEKKESVWEKAWNWADEHQTEIALGLGVAVGIAAIVITGGIASPLVAAAVVAGAAASTAAGAALGTVALNIHYEREWNTNVLKNATLAGAAAAVVAGGWFLLHGAMTGVGAYCANSPKNCALV
jgi:hypothetical protein